MAAANSENLVRMWDLESDQNYILNLTGIVLRGTVCSWARFFFSLDGKGAAGSRDLIRCLAFNPRRRVLCAVIAAHLCSRAVQRSTYVTPAGNATRKSCDVALHWHAG